ncbi:putative ribonuclease H-like domain-containing protein [Tanacetum coccineum]
MVTYHKGKEGDWNKWVFRNKRDERGDYYQEQSEAILHKVQSKKSVWNYDEVFAICTSCQNEAIRLFLAFASFMGFTVYQMDVKSAFLYGNITEEVYVKQPPGFEDPAHAIKVHTLEKEYALMIHMLAYEKRSSIKRVDDKYAEHGMEVEDESGDSLTLIHLVQSYVDNSNGDNS